jgi:hypothetical protein
MGRIGCVCVYAVYFQGDHSYQTKYSTNDLSTWSGDLAMLRISRYWLFPNTSTYDLYCRLTQESWPIAMQCTVPTGISRYRYGSPLPSQKSVIKKYARQDVLAIRGISNYIPLLSNQIHVTCRLDQTGGPGVSRYGSVTKQNTYVLYEYTRTRGLTGQVVYCYLQEGIANPSCLNKDQTALF